VVILKKKSQKKGQYDTELKIAKGSDLPMDKGTHMGWVIVKTKDGEVARVRLETSDKVDKASFLQLWQRSWKNLTSHQKF
jgi:D-alanyl-D-alanine carboxypeptidase (penicillin-binding protein 5/6)